METFPIVKRKDDAAHCEYRTKRVILEMYDCMASLPPMLVPAPKPVHGEIDMPDVSRWGTPPADPPYSWFPARLVGQTQRDRRLLSP